MTQGTHARNPYPGPRPFKPEEYSIFAGRDYEISELCSLTISHQVVVLYAQSGAGKTSVLNAGLGFGVPNQEFAEGHGLKRKGVQLLPAARVGIPVPQTVPLGKVHNVYTFSAIGDLLPRVPDEATWLWTATLAEALDRIPARKDDAGDPGLRVIAFDQFEELFSSYPERWRDRIDFINQVAEALRKDSFLRVLFVLREDYLGAFVDLAGRLPEGARTRYHLERLREPEALLAIKQPLEGTQWEFPDAVAESLVKDLMTITVEDPSGKPLSVPGEYVEPVQLQVVCHSLLERLLERAAENAPSHTKITIDDVRTLGDPDGALQLFYENAIKMALKNPGVDEDQLRSWFETYLITPAGTRGLVFQDRQRNMTGGIPNSVIDVLDSQHLIRAEPRSGSRWYELTHDRFIGPIQKSNQKWKSELGAQYAAAVRKAATAKDASPGVLMDMVPLLLPKNEQAHLINLVRRRTAGYRGNHPLRSELRRLRSLGLIRTRSGQQVGYMKDGSSFDLADYVELTDLGERWAATIQQIEILGNELQARVTKEVETIRRVSDELGAREDFPAVLDQLMKETAGSVSASSAPTIVVSPEGAGFRSISMAIRQAVAGARILARGPAEYRESLTIDKPLELIGEAGVKLVGIGGPAITSTGVAVRISKLNITAEGFNGVKISGGYGVLEQLEVSGTRSSAVLIRDGAEAVLAKCSLHHAEHCGLHVQLGSKCTVVSSTVRGNGVGGLFFSQGAEGLAEGNLIERNGSNGIYIAAGANPRISRNQIRHHRYAGVLVYQQDEWRSDYGPGRGTLEGNEITDGEFGIQILDGADPCVRRNVIKGNRKGGIWTRKRGRGTIVENRILENLGPGIINEEGHPLIGQNVFYGNQGRDIDDRGGATQDDKYTCQALKKVLWVDDNPSYNDELVDRYRPLGISFDLALNTKQALDFLAQGDYDLIISDISRGADWEAGISMIPEIRNRFPKAPPIIICAHPKAVEAHGKRARDLGASLVTASPEDVMRRLDNILA